MPATHRNRLVTAISNTPGTSGALTIAAAASGYRTFGAADDGLSFDVSIVDGTDWEIRTGCVYTHSGTSLSRGTLEDSSTGSAIDLTSAAVVTVTMTAGMGNQLVQIAENAASMVTLTGAETLTNKRILPRTVSVLSSATPAINTDACDVYQLTAQAEAITAVSVTGTPVDNQCLVVEITGTAARAIAWGASFEPSTVALPTTTVTTAMLTVGFIYNSTTSKWRCVGAV